MFIWLRPSQTTWLELGEWLIPDHENKRKKGSHGDRIDQTRVDWLGWTTHKGRCPVLRGAGAVEHRIRQHV